MEKVIIEVRTWGTSLYIPWPKRMRDYFPLQAGDYLIAEKVDEDTIVLKRVKI